MKIFNLLAAGILLFLPTATFAQSEVGGATLNGTILDKSRAAVPKAKVTILSTETGLKRTAESSEAGLYAFPRIPVGTYDLAVDATGFKTSKRSAITLQVGAIATIDIPMEVGTAQESVTVTAETPVIETTRSASAVNVTQQAVANLPVNGRNFIDFVTLSPAVVKDVRGGDLSFAGQRGPANTLLVDGADSNNLFYGQAVGRTGFRPYSFSEDAVQEFQINNSGYMAEIGRAGGGAVNVITKSGTNQFHGSAFEFFRDKGLNANTFVNNRGGVKKLPYHYNQFGGTVGGPIVKDKLFLFFSYDGQRNTSSQIVVPNIAPTGAALALLQKYLSPYLLGLNNNVYLGKIDWNINNSDRLTARLNFSRYTGVNQESFGSNVAEEHSGNNQVNTDNIAVIYTKVLSPRALLDVRYNYVADKEPGFANTNGPEVAITNGITFGKNNFSPRYTNAYTNQPVATLSYLMGRHNMKFGVDMNFERIENYFPGFFAGGYTFPSYDAFVNKQPSSYQQAFSGNSADAPVSHPNSNEFAFFAQDSWHVNDRLTLNLGIRYDLFRYKQPTTFNKDAGLAAAKLRTDIIPQDNTNFAPRFGFAFKPMKSDRTVIRGGFGMFYGRTPAILTSTAILQNGIDVLTYGLTSGFPTYPNVLSAPPNGGLAPPSINVMDPNFKSPVTNQWNLQVEQALAKDYSITVGYLGVHGYHLARTRDINLQPSVLTTGTISTGGTIQYWRHPGVNAPIRPNPAFGRISLFESAADSVYHGVFLQVTKRFSNDFQLLASYTFAKVIDSAPDATSVVVGNGGDEAKVAQDTLLPNLDRGPGQNDIRNRFVGSFVWDLNYAKAVQNKFAKELVSGWNLSGIVQMQSGRHLSIGTTGDPNNDGNNFNDRAPLVGRNTLEGPGLGTFDLRFSRNIRIMERAHLKLIFEAFNVANRANFNGIQTNLYGFRAGVFTPTTNYLFRQTMLDQGIGNRVLQVAAKFNF